MVCDKPPNTADILPKLGVCCIYIADNSDSIVAAADILLFRAVSPLFLADGFLVKDQDFQVLSLSGRANRPGTAVGGSRGRL
jgi:hypothetical protein